jgi:hypothetical protein
MSSNSTTTISLLKVLTTLLLGVLIQTQSLAGNSGFGIEPTRVVISANEKSGSINLNNTSNQPVAYRMTLVEMGLDDSGAFRRLLDSELPAGHRSAKPVIRFSPRQVRLKPGEKQVVRVIARRKPGMAEGEYRSHLMIQALPILSENMLEQMGESNEDIALVSASAGTSVGFTIPVIVRHGKTEASVELKDFQVLARPDNSLAAAQITLGLNGNRSALGPISLSIPNGNKWREIGSIKGYALFSPYPQESLQIRLHNDISTADVIGKQVRIVFNNSENSAGEPATWLDTTAIPTVVQMTR